MLDVDTAEDKRRAILVAALDTIIAKGYDGARLIDIGRRAGVSIGLIQHYFDTRGVARVYAMTLQDNVWRLWRDTPDFSPLHFRQRYAGTIAEDGRTITGAWEICHDGQTWQHDFDLRYEKLG